MNKNKWTREEIKKFVGDVSEMELPNPVDPANVDDVNMFVAGCTYSKVETKYVIIFTHGLRLSDEAIEKLEDTVLKDISKIETKLKGFYESHWNILDALKRI